MSTSSLTPTSRRRRAARALARAYDLIVFPGHHEYVTTHEYDLDRAATATAAETSLPVGEQLLLADREARTSSTKTQQWRDLGRPEAALIGVQYRDNDRGDHRGAWIVREGPPLAFRRDGLREGSGFGSGGIEVDRRRPNPRAERRSSRRSPTCSGPG